MSRTKRLIEQQSDEYRTTDCEYEQASDLPGHIRGEQVGRRRIVLFIFHSCILSQ